MWTVISIKILSHPPLKWLIVNGVQRLLFNRSFKFWIVWENVMRAKIPHNVRVRQSIRVQSYDITAGIDYNKGWNLSILWNDHVYFNRSVKSVCFCVYVLLHLLTFIVIGLGLKCNCYIWYSCKSLCYHTNPGVAQKYNLHTNLNTL